MKQKKRKYDDPNCIEETARELFGYDDASLNAEMNEAERAWAAEKAANPEAAAKAQRDADEGFDKLMANIRKKGIQPVSEAEYEEEEKKNNQKTKRLGRKGKKVLVLAAVVCVMGLGTTMVVSARRGYEYKIYPVQEQSQQNKVIRRNSVRNVKTGRLETAYKDISENLDIRILALGHMPTGLDLKNVVVDEEHAVLEFEYDGKTIYFKEANIPLDFEISGLILSDRKELQPIHNEWLDKIVYLEENILEDGQIEYSVSIDIDNNYYYLSGMMEKEEFIKIVEGICYY